MQSKFVVLEQVCETVFRTNKVISNLKMLSLNLPKLVQTILFVWLQLARQEIEKRTAHQRLKKISFVFI